VVDVPVNASPAALHDPLLVDDEPSNTSVIVRCCDDRLNSP